MDYRSVVAMKVNFGAAVASVFKSKRLAIETITGMGIQVLNYLMYM